ncbi:MAG: hypothetical protein GY810_19210 [Aureispira sp.]|nr:hypothetical protein [Aureispira sp.]
MDLKEFGKLIQKSRKKLDRYNKIIQSNTRNSFAYQQRMEVNILLGNVEQGLQDLKKALELSPNDQDLINHPLNINNTNPAAPTTLEYAMLFFNIANYFYRKEEYSTALKYIDLALDREDRLHNVFTLKGFILHEGKIDATKALIAIESALALKADSAMARYGRGLIIAKKYPMRFTLSESFELEKDNGEIEGNVLELQQALSDLNFALEQLGDNKNVHMAALYQKIQVQYSLNQFDEAGKSLKYAIQEYGENQIAYFLGTLIHFQRGNTEESNKDFKKFVESIEEGDLKTVLQMIVNNADPSKGSFVEQAQQHLGGNSDDDAGSRGSILDDMDFNLN